MADSENSRTVPAITCRNLLQTTECFLMARAGKQLGLHRGRGDDPLAKWSVWISAFRKLDRLEVAQQRLESELLEVSAPDGGSEMAGGPFFVPAMEIDGSRVSAYRKAEQAASGAADVEAQAAADLSETPAYAIDAVIAKLHCVLQRAQPGPECPEWPWPILRLSLIDLLFMAETPPEPFAGSARESAPAGQRRSNKPL